MPSLSESDITDMLKSVNKKGAKREDDIFVSTLADPHSLCIVKDWVSSGCLPIDLIMGGGFPFGRIVEIYGDEASGKSLLATQVVIEAQRIGAMTVFADVEAAVSLPLMKQLGVDVKRLIYFTPDTVSQLFEKFNELIDAKNKRLGLSHPMVFVWDSVAATTTLQEQEETDLDKRQYASAAPQISRAMRVIARKIAQSNVCAVLTNQMKHKLGVIFGDDDATFGGKAIAFHATIRLRLKAGGAIRDANKKAIGVRVFITVKKNKVAAPFREAMVPIYFGRGVDEPEAILEMAKKLGVVYAAGPKSVINIDGNDVVFTRKGWNKILYDNYDPICDAVEDAFNAK